MNFIDKNLWRRVSGILTSTKKSQIKFDVTSDMLRQSAAFRPSSSVRPLALEQRFMFDGAAVAVAAEQVHSATPDTA
jgi:hypothetical protein